VEAEMSIEAMKQALEVLEQINQLSIGENAIALPGEIDGAMDNLRAAIEQAEKPVAWRWKEVKGEFVGDWVLTEIEPPPYVTESMPLYTAPREWVELTDDEARALVNRATFGERTNWQALVYMIDAKLKEKNG
jgi:hypothetical protein